MKIKIWDTIYDSNDQPIMIILDKNEKKLIANMAENATKFASFPEDSNKTEIEEWMKDE